LAAFLVANLVTVLLAFVDWLGWQWLARGDWLVHLNAEVERGSMDRYQGVLFGVVAALAAAQVLRPPPARGGPRWLWTLGWLSAAFFIALVAFEELHRQVDMGSLVGPALGLEELGARHRWALVAALVYDAVGDLLVNFLGFSTAGPEPISVVVEEGAELMAAGSLAVIFIEMLASQSGPVRHVRPMLAGPRRWVALTLAVALLTITGFALSTPQVFEDNRWIQTWVHGVGERPELRRLAFENDRQVRMRPWSYTGPISLVEQRFRAEHDNLLRIDVWTYVDGGPGTSEIFARLTPEGSNRPIRESRMEVRGARFSDTTAAFHFAPIPDSAGTTYTLAVGVLSGSQAYVFLGLTDGALNPAGDALISGAPSRHGEDLAMRTSWTGRLAQGILAQDSRRLALAGEIVVNLFLWVFAVVATWSALSRHRPRFWRHFVWPAVGVSALVTAGIIAITLALLAVRTPALA